MWTAMMRSPEAYIEVGLFAERQPMSGLTKQFEGFMKKYGYRDANGWWVRS